MVLDDKRPEHQRPRPEDKPCPAWRMHLRFAPGLLPPGPPWTMFEGDHIGSGYELHWFPERFTLQIVRAPDKILLGSAVLRRFPDEVVFVRRGLRLQVWIDGQTVLSCLDPAGTTPLPIAWGIHAAGELGSSSLSLHDDRLLLDRHEKNALTWTTATPANAEDEYLPPLLKVRRALLANPATASAEALISRAFGAGLKNPVLVGQRPATLSHIPATQGADTVSSLGADHPDQASLLAWLDWCNLQLLLRCPDRDLPAPGGTHGRCQEIATVLEHLETLARSQPAPECLGMFLNLLDIFSARACSHAKVPKPPPATALNERDEWLRLMRITGGIALRLNTEAGQPLPERWRWQLRLCLHAARCLMGKDPSAAGEGDLDINDEHLPAEAPDWVICRWQALAGYGPGGPAFVGNNPADEDESNPVGPILDRLLKHAELEPLAATETSARLAELVERFEEEYPDLVPQKQIERRAKVEADVNQILERTPEREAMLQRVLLALRGIGDAAKVHEALYPKEARERKPGSATDRPLSWAERDPLAYALDCLLLVRVLSSTPQGIDLLRNPTTLPPDLESYRLLLSGSLEPGKEAGQYAWDYTGLPPAQALAAALAIQEVARRRETTTFEPSGKVRIAADALTVEWPLLERIPAFTVLLRFAMPATPNAPDIKRPVGEPLKPPSVP